MKQAKASKSSVKIKTESNAKGKIKRSEKFQVKKGDLLKKFSGKYFFGLGRRKTAVAKVRIYGDAGDKAAGMWVNALELEKYFPGKEMQERALAPLQILPKEDAVSLSARVTGGGKSGQAEAVRLGLARALVKYNEEYKKQLREAGYLTRDARKVERKKPGLKKARRAPQFSKR